MRMNISANVTIGFECSDEETEMFLERDKFNDIFRVATRTAKENLDSEFNKKKDEFEKRYEETKARIQKQQEELEKERAEFEKEYQKRSETLKGWDSVENTDQKKVEEVDDDDELY